jgi:hypothetical protein
VQRNSSGLRFEIKKALVNPTQDRVSGTTAGERWQCLAQPSQIAPRLSDEMTSQLLQNRLHNPFVGAKRHLAPTGQVLLAGYAHECPV